MEHLVRQGGNPRWREDIRIDRLYEESFAQYRRIRDTEFPESMLPSYMDPLQMELKELERKNLLKKEKKKKIILLL